jgi:hypothetical protein
MLVSACAGFSWQGRKRSGVKNWFRRDASTSCSETRGLKSRFEVCIGRPSKVTGLRTSFCQSHREKVFLAKISYVCQQRLCTSPDELVERTISEESKKSSERLVLVCNASL